MTEKEMDNKTKASKDTIDYSRVKEEFTGQYLQAIGKRKTSAAQVRLYQKGSGIVMINGRSLIDYFPALAHQTAVIKPLVIAGLEADLDCSVLVSGGGLVGQAEAIAHGLARCLVQLNEELKPSLKTEGLVSRDARRKERKKPGLKKARRAPQWSKR